MSDLARRLQQALGETYLIERELGGGGMSRVFVAEEAALRRKVVLKVLPPELAAGLNIERFRREIQLAASLQHPHIVPVLAAGQADGLLYFTMPLVQGESLRSRLSREGRQPIAEAVRVLRDVADALAYAHQHGIVHRDIKPDNILVAHHHALVTDFGVAKALSDSTGRSEVTSAGVALGTPAYMAPEQAAGDPLTDHRADIYAAGVVGYELLVGRPPFVGGSPQAVLAAQVTQTPLPVTSLRGDVPPGLAQLVMRCLAKQPEDRWASADILLDQLDGFQAETGHPPLVGPLPRRRRTWLVVTAAVVVAMAAAWAARGWRRPAIGPGDPQAVAVFPFRVSGADPSLAYLREGMVELLAVKLTGEGGPRAVDPSATLNAWRRTGGDDGDLDRAAALRAAQSLGAGRALKGSVVGSPARLTLTAAILQQSADEVRFSVEGPLDSLSGLVDRLTAGVLAGGEVGHGALSSLTTTSLPALRAYLDGRSFYRRGSYRQAVAMFERTLGLDSGFALAGLGLANAAGWCCDGGLVERGIRLAWVSRGRLGLPDRAVLEAMAGPRYPGESSQLERLRAWERVVVVAPDRPDAWYRLGDILYHWGQVLGMPDAWARASKGFERALELDSTFAGPLEHMAEMAAHNGDSTTAARLIRLALASDSTSEIADYLRWRVLVVTGDTTALSAHHLEVERWPAQSLFTALIVILHDAIPVQEARPLMAVADQRNGTREERDYASYYHWAVGLNAGRPAEALQGARSVPYLEDDPWFNHETALVQAAFWEGDSGAAAAAARDLASRRARTHTDTLRDEYQEIARLCALEQWNLARGEFATAAQTLAVLERASRLGAKTETRSVAAFCGRMVDAWQAGLRRAPEAAAKLASLDSSSRTGPPQWLDHFQHANLLLARLHEAQGDVPRALEAVRRRHYGLGLPLYLSSYLREEGRLAALVGDRAGAIAAYRHYLALRQDPEPSLRPELEHVRRELAKLLAER